MLVDFAACDFEDEIGKGVVIQRKAAAVLMGKDIGRHRRDALVAVEEGVVLIEVEKIRGGVTNYFLLKDIARLTISERKRKASCISPLPYSRLNYLIMHRRSYDKSRKIS
jgi:hypothetical protein